MTKRFDSAEEMERIFDAGEESVLDYADMSTATVTTASSSTRTGWATWGRRRRWRS